MLGLNRFISRIPKNDSYYAPALFNVNKFSTVVKEKREKKPKAVKKYPRKLFLQIQKKKNKNKVVDIEDYVRTKKFETGKVKTVATTNATPVQLKTGNTDIKEGNELKQRYNPLGRQYQELVHRGRLGNPLSIKDLKAIIVQTTTEKKTFKYATFLVNLFQKKNQDFSKVTCTEYVNAAIRADRLDIIIDEFLVFRNRISAWVTDDTFNEFAKTLENKGEAEKTIKVFHMLTRKGVNIKELGGAIVLKASAETCDSEIYEKTIECLHKTLNPQFIPLLIAKYPLLEKKAEVEAVEEVEGGVEGVEGGVEKPVV